MYANDTALLARSELDVKIIIESNVEVHRCRIM